jgi:hypothetical protein
VAGLVAQLKVGLLSAQASAGGVVRQPGSGRGARGSVGKRDDRGGVEWLAARNVMADPVSHCEPLKTLRTNWAAVSDEPAYSPWAVESDRMIWIAQ